MVKKIKDSTLAKLSERLQPEFEEELAPESNHAKINCWTCGKYDAEAEHCYHCSDCNLWTLKKIFLHNRRFLRHLDRYQLNKMGFSEQL
jgi:hypothetical protein